MNKHDIFYQDYVGEEQTDTGVQRTYEKDYAEILEDITDKDYGISKPRRIIIRGKIINGKG